MYGVNERFSPNELPGLYLLLFSHWRSGASDLEH